MLCYNMILITIKVQRSLPWPIYLIFTELCENISANKQTNTDEIITSLADVG